MTCGRRTGSGTGSEGATDRAARQGIDAHQKTPGHGAALGARHLAGRLDVQRGGLRRPDVYQPAQAIGLHPVAAEVPTGFAQRRGGRGRRDECLAERPEEAVDPLSCRHAVDHALRRFDLRPVPDPGLLRTCERSLDLQRDMRTAVGAAEAHPGLVRAPPLGSAQREYAYESSPPIRHPTSWSRQASNDARPTR